MPFYPESLSIFIYPSVSMTSISIHVSISIRSSSIGKQDRYLVNRFWDLTQEIPKHIWILQIGLRISLLSVNKIRELLRISDEKDRSIVSNHIPIPFFSIEFDCKSSRISLGICTSFFSSNCRKS